MVIDIYLKFKKEYNINYLLVLRKSEYDARILNVGLGLSSADWKVLNNGNK